MSQYMLPTTDDFVDSIAKAIARDRMYREASDALEDLIGIRIESVDRLDRGFDPVFETVWNGNKPIDIEQREAYRLDARAAIAAINLKLLVSE